MGYHESMAVSSNGKTVVRATVDKKVKERVERLAKQQGTTLAAVIEQGFRDFLGKRTTASKIQKEVALKPSPRLEKILKEARDNWDNPDYWSGPFTSEEFERHMRGLMKKRHVSR